MSFSDYLEDALLDHVFKTAALSVPTNLYVALSTADPLDDASALAEPSGNNYARVNHNAWAEAASGAISNTGAVTFPEASGSWGTVTHFAIFDAATDGNMLVHGELAASKAIGDGDTFSFPSGDLDISLT